MEDRLKSRLQLLPDSGKAEVVFHASASCRSECAPAFVVPDELKQRVGERHVIGCLDEESGVADDFRYGARARGNDGDSAGHTLDENDAELLLPEMDGYAGKYEDVRG